MLAVRLGRCRPLALIAAALLCVSVALLSRLTAATPEWQVTLLMAAAGLGAGAFFSLPNVVAQVALPHAVLGAGISAITYVRLLGQLTGAAAIGGLLREGDVLGGLQTGFLAVAIVAAGMVVVAALCRDVRLAGPG